MVRRRAETSRKAKAVAPRQFRAEVKLGHKGPAIVLPFDPETAWGEARRHLVWGTLNGCPFDGEIGFRRRVHYTLLDDDLLGAAKLQPGDSADVVMQPRPPRSDEKGAPPRLACVRRAIDVALEKVREIVQSLPDTKETPTWGAPHFRVGEKIFCGCGPEGERLAITFKLEMPHAHFIVEDPRFTRAPYVGHKGWISMDATCVDDWDEVRALILESYRLIAPKKSLAKLGDAAEPSDVKTKKTKAGKAKRG
ncbi:MAG: MmcQ/YjbR family DNA-binding protein [Planctomycetes bacterium]|nr:MmcQ/YjbR family DNA-binding protein [Planctomycetota bacterium]MBI3847224.1 MmcQ/YjbR family DNA-binding protein [Planctomycetota bacterium]